MPNLVHDLRFLRCALLAADHGSFRRAADALNISQSTLSRRILQLEAQLGTSLFERTPAGARVTIAGERFFTEARIGARHFQQAVEALSSLSRGETGGLRIGLVASLGKGFLADLLEKYRRRYPYVEVTVAEATAQRNTAAVMRGNLDVAFVPTIIRPSGCELEHLWEERIFVTLPLGHRLTSRAHIVLDDIKSETLLTTSDTAGPDIKDYLVRHLSSLGFRPKIVCHHVGRENLLNLVARGFGVTLTTQSTLGVTYPGVEFRPLAIDHATISSSVVWCSSNSNAALKRLLQLARTLRKRGPAAEEVNSFPSDNIL